MSLTTEEETWEYLDEYIEITLEVSDLSIDLFHLFIYLFFTILETMLLSEHMELRILNKIFTNSIKLKCSVKCYLCPNKNSFYKIHQALLHPLTKSVKIMHFRMKNLIHSWQSTVLSSQKAILPLHKHGGKRSLSHFSFCKGAWQNTVCLLWETKQLAFNGQNGRWRRSMEERGLSMLHLLHGTSW